MGDWRADADKGRWREIRWLHLTLADRHELLDRLQSVVPKTWDENGTERIERFIHPAETHDPQLKVAARLLLGELEASLTENPAEASEAWMEAHSEIVARLKEMLAGEEVTTGAPALSRKAHARAALDDLATVDLVAVLMAGELDDLEDVRWLREGLAEVAHVAFTAGVLISTQI